MFKDFNLWGAALGSFIGLLIVFALYPEANHAGPIGVFVGILACAILKGKDD